MVRLGKTKIIFSCLIVTALLIIGTIGKWPDTGPWFPTEPSLKFVNFTSYAKELQSTTTRKIFFVETRDLEEICFSVRQSCAVESAARINPGAEIFMFVRSKTLSNCSTVQLLKWFPNIKMVHYTLASIFEGTPLVDWGAKVTSGNITGPYIVSHLSDALRFTLLSKFTGIYMDLDFFTLRPLDRFFAEKVVLAKEGDTWMSAAFLGLNGSHPYFVNAVKEFAATYNGSKWAHNGPGLVQRLLDRQKCDVKLDRCKDIALISKRTVYPLPFEDWRLLFNGKPVEIFDDPDIVALHLWNKVSSRTPSPTNVTNTINVAASRSCPSSFHVAETSESREF